MSDAARTTSRTPLVLGGLALAWLVASVLALMVGPVEIAPGRVWAVLAEFFGVDADVSRVESLVVGRVRLPRVVLGSLVGAAMAVSGAGLQAMFRNPLAAPGLIGVSAGASLGAVSAIVVGTTWVEFLVPTAWVVPAAAFAGALAVTWLVLRLATRRGHTSVATMLLAGIAINAAVGAIIGFLSYVATTQQLRALVLWTLGSLVGANWTEVALLAGPALAVTAVLGWRAQQLDALQLGDREAGHLGVSVPTLHRLVVVLSALGVGAAVAFVGPIGFVGLVAPHVVRLLVGPGHRALIPGAAVAGAALVVIADTVARTALAPAELPIGILTAAVGAPFFLVLLLSTSRRGELH